MNPKLLENSTTPSSLTAPGVPTPTPDTSSRVRRASPSAKRQASFMESAMASAGRGAAVGTLAVARMSFCSLTTPTAMFVPPRSMPSLTIVVLLSAGVPDVHVFHGDVGGIFFHAEVFQQFFGGIVAHLLEAVVDGRHLNDDGKVPAGVDRDGIHGDFEAEDVHGLVCQAHAFICLGVVPGLEVDDEVDALGHFDGAHAEDSAGVDDADAPQFHEVADVLRCGADQGLLGHPADFHRVVSHETVSALDELDHGLALTDTALAHNEDAFAGDLDEDPVEGDPFRQFHVQVRNERGHDEGGLLVGPQDGHFIFFPVRDELFSEFLGEVLGKDDGSGTLRHEPLNALGADVRLELSQIEVFGVAQKLDALRHEVVVVPGQDEAGAADFHGVDQDVFRLLRQIDRDELFRTDDLIHGNRVFAFHMGPPLKQDSIQIILP